MKALALGLLLVSPTAFAEISSVTTDFDQDGKPDVVSLGDVAGNDEALLLTVAMGNGTRVRNQVLLRKVGQNGESGASLKVLAPGRVMVSSVKDWSSANTALDVVLGYSKGALKISALVYTWDFHGAFGGCEFDFARGTLQVNGKNRRYSARSIRFTENSNVDEYAASCVKLSR